MTKKKSKTKKIVTFKIKDSTYEFIKMLSTMSGHSINDIAKDLLELKLQELYEETKEEYVQ